MGINLLFILVTFPIEPEALQPVHIKIQLNVIEFLNVFKQYEKQQSTVASQRSYVSNEFIYCLKGLVSISKTMLCFLTSLAAVYFPEHPDMATLGRQLADEYADCDSIMYNCMQSLIEKLR
uniref:Putative secreted protein n=1 Tax=Anopheles triannulatus TaxID=58253 RepID=A0A2M4B2S0_9DIPT